MSLVIKSQDFQVSTLQLARQAPLNAISNTGIQATFKLGHWSEVVDIYGAILQVLFLLTFVLCTILFELPYLSCIQLCTQ